MLLCLIKLRKQFEYNQKNFQNALEKSGCFGFLEIMTRLHLSVGYGLNNRFFVILPFLTESLKTGFDCAIHRLMTQFTEILRCILVCF